MIPKDREKRKRYLQALGIAIALHLAAGLSLGCFDNWISPDTSGSKIIEVTLGRPGHKKRVEVKKPKPVPIKPRKDDIVDKNLKPVPENNEPDQQEDVEDNNLNSTGESTGASTGNATSEGDGGSDGVAVERPYVISSSKPDYPVAAKKQGVQGTVGLRILINESGRVESASVASSSGDASLDSAAVASIYKWRFSPAKNAKGKKIPCYVSIPITFKLR